MKMYENNFRLTQPHVSDKNYSGIIRILVRNFTLQNCKILLHFQQIMCPSAAIIKSAISLFSELAVKFQLTCSLSTKKYSTQKKDIRMLKCEQNIGYFGNLSFFSVINNSIAC